MYHIFLLPSLKHDQRHDYSLPLLLHGDIDFNPAPKCNVSNIFQICRWSVNSAISAHNYII